MRHQIQSTFFGFLERIFPARPEDLKANVDIERSLSIKLYRFTVFTLCSVFLFFAAQYTVLGSVKVALLQGLVATVFLMSWVIYYRTGKIYAAANFILFFGASSACFRAYYMGGVRSPAFFIWPLIPVFTSILLPGRQAMFWTGLYISFALGFDFVDRVLGIHIMSQLSPRGISNVRIVSIVSVQLILFGAMYFLRVINRKYRELSVSEKEAKTNLLRVLSHDMASPLTTLQYTLDRIKEEGGKLDEKDLSRIERAVSAATSILSHVRELEAIGSGKLRLKHEPVDLSAVLQDVVFLQDENAKKKGVTLKIETLQGTERPWVVSDRRALTHQVLGNLVSNAIKFTPTGGTVFLGWSIGKGEGLDWVDLWVQDSGVGIPISILNVIFDPTHHTTRPGTSGEKGTGFGMPLVKSYVDAMGGQIEITSSIDEKAPTGTRIEIALIAKNSEKGRALLDAAVIPSSALVSKNPAA